MRAATASHSARFFTARPSRLRDHPSREVLARQRGRILGTSCSPGWSCSAEICRHRTSQRGSGTPIEGNKRGRAQPARLTGSSHGTRETPRYRPMRTLPDMASEQHSWAFNDTRRTSERATNRSVATRAAGRGRDRDQGRGRRMALGGVLLLALDAEALDGRPSGLLRRVFGRITRVGWVWPFVRRTAMCHR